MVSQCFCPKQGYGEIGEGELCTRFGDHDVVVVSVSNPQDKCGYTVSCTGVDESLYSLFKLGAQGKKRKHQEMSVKVQVLLALRWTYDVFDCPVV